MRWRLGGAVILAVVIISTVYGAAAQSPDEITAVISAPVEGQQLFGLATITGSAGHPTAFDSYTLEYNLLSDPNAPWVLVQEPVRQQVENNVLGAWDTIFVADGVYALRLRVALTDGQVGETIVSNLRVINSEPTPVPGGAPGLTEATPIPTLGPTPTSPIEQPPSNNPGLDTNDPSNSLGSSAGAGLPVATTDDQTTTETRINIGRVRSAFCAGVYLTMIVFGVMLVYSLLRGRLRPFTRRMVVQVRDDYDVYE